MVRLIVQPLIHYWMQDKDLAKAMFKVRMKSIEKMRKELIQKFITFANSRVTVEKFACINAEMKKGENEAIENALKQYQEKQRPMIEQLEHDKKGLAAKLQMKESSIVNKQIEVDNIKKQLENVVESNSLLNIKNYKNY